MFFGVIRFFFLATHKMKKHIYKLNRNISRLLVVLVFLKKMVSHIRVDKKLIVESMEIIQSNFHCGHRTHLQKRPCCMTPNLFFVAKAEGCWPRLTTLSAAVSVGFKRTPRAPSQCQPEIIGHKFLSNMVQSQF